MLWSWASEFTPAGDIGRYPDETIAEEVCWLGSPSELLRALLAAGWIQADSACRYRIHDWPDHCEDTIHARLARSHQRFADGSIPKLTKLSADEKRQAEEFYQRQPDSAKSSLPRPAPAPAPAFAFAPSPAPAPTHPPTPRPAIRAKKRR